MLFFERLVYEFMNMICVAKFNHLTNEKSCTLNAVGRGYVGF